MNSDISIVTIKNERQLLEHNIDGFSAELFGEDSLRLFPIYAIFYKGAFRGYAHAIEQHVVYPALHPDRMDAREFFVIARDLVREFKRMVGNPIYMICPKGQEQLSVKQLEAIGLTPTGERSYIYLEKGGN